MPRSTCRLVHRETGEELIARLELATTFGTRFLGLQFRRSLPSNTGLLIAPCPSIHTFAMRFPIDAAFVDADGNVVEVREAIKPWRVCIPKAKSRFVVETPADARVLSVGTPIEVVCQTAVPRVLRNIARCDDQ